MKLMICGPRDLKLPASRLANIVKQYVNPDGVDVVVTGDAWGVDHVAILYARKWLGCPFVAFGAGWGRMGLSAGPQRNRMAVNYLDFNEDVLLAIKDSRETSGTNNALRYARSMELECHEHKDESLDRYIVKKEGS